MLENIIDILNNIIGEDDYTLESKAIESLIKRNKSIQDIYLVDEVQLILMKTKSRFVSFDDCNNVVKAIKSSKEAAL